MDIFFRNNLLNIYSLFILVIMLFQVKKQLKANNRHSIQIWLTLIAVLTVIQVLEIISWLYTALSGDFYLYLSYFCNTVIYILACILTCLIALFVEYNAKFSKKAVKRLKKFFLPIIALYTLIVFLNIPTGLLFYYDDNGIYTYGNWYVLHILFVFSPLVIELCRLIFIHKDVNQIRYVLIMGIICPVLFILLRIVTNIEIYFLFPSITLSLIIMNFFIINTDLSIDYLTGLKNKRGIEEYFSRLPLTLNDYFTLIYIDINNFKSINDTYGHQEGDNALKSLGKIINNTIRINDLGAREGGDEFLIALQTTRENDYKTVLDRLHEQIAAYNNKNTYNLDISCGICVTKPLQRINKEQILQTADRNMYLDKARNRQKGE